MLWKDIKDSCDCELCPLYKEEICVGGYTSSPGGDPIEPPCCYFDDDTDLDKWVSDHWDKVRRIEERQDMQYKKEQEKKRKARVAQRKREYLKYYCWDERKEVSRIKKRIKSIENSVYFAESLASAINITNEMFNYSERMKANPKISEELDSLKQKLVEAENKLKAKQKEGRETIEYKQICIKGIVDEVLARH